MTSNELKVLKSIQNLVTYARFKSYKGESHSEIAELLDDADHLCNLICEDNADYARIENLLKSLLLKHPCSSTVAFNVRLNQE
jgi:hypothetical protein